MLSVCGRKNKAYVIVRLPRRGTFAEEVKLFEFNNDKNCIINQNSSQSHISGFSNITIEVDNGINSIEGARPLGIHLEKL